jgi:NADH-quinone oxidoreductase subunit K
MPDLSQLTELRIGLNHYLWLSAFMFTTGVVGVLSRRNAIVIFMCIELMLNAVNLSFVAFSHFLADVQGQMMVFFVMTVAAAEAAVGLAIVIALFRNKQTVNINDINLLKG